MFLRTLAVDEVVLNKQQQAALGGDTTFANIGMEGFGSPTYSTAPNPMLFSNNTSITESLI